MPSDQSMSQGGKCLNTPMSYNTQVCHSNLGADKK